MFIFDMMNKHFNLH